MIDFTYTNFTDLTHEELRDAAFEALQTSNHGAGAVLETLAHVALVQSAAASELNEDALSVSYLETHAVIQELFPNIAPDAVQRTITNHTWSFKGRSL